MYDKTKRQIKVIMPVNQEPRNEQGQPHGQWICYLGNGTIWFMDHNINGVEYGYSIYYENEEDGESFYVKEYYAR